VLMGAREHPDAENTPYFITTVTHNRQKVFAGASAAEMFLEELNYARQELGFALLSFVVMPDHVHLLLVPRSPSPLSLVMQTIKGRFARRWNRRQNTRGKLWQPRYVESGVRTEAQLHKWIQYIDLNPVEAGLAPSPGQYQFSSVSGALSIDVEAYFDGTWPGQAEAWPSAVVGAR